MSSRETKMQNEKLQQFTNEDTMTQVDRMADEGEAQEQNLDHPSQEVPEEDDNFQDDRNPDPNEQRPIEVDPDRQNPYTPSDPGGPRDPNVPPPFGGDRESNPTADLGPH